MARKQPEEVEWSVYYVGKKQIWIGSIKAVDEQAAIKAATEEFNRPAAKLIVHRK